MINVKAFLASLVLVWPNVVSSSEPIYRFTVTASDATSGICHDLISQKRVSNFATVYSMMMKTKEIQKSEFETETEFLKRKDIAAERIKKMLRDSSQSPYLYHSFRINYSPYDKPEGISYKYDAHNQTLTIPYISSDKNFGGTQSYPGDQLLQYGMDRVPVKLISTVEVSGGSYKGQNGFGATRTIRETSSNSKYWGFVRIPFNQSFAEQFDISFVVNVNGTQAKEILPFSRVIIAGELLEPGVGSVWAQSRGPTFSRPYSYKETAHVLFAKPVCAALYDVRTFKVIQAKSIVISKEPYVEQRRRY